ncbi:MAG TPA: DUF4129 domain-containing protein [Pyrinomonadaceae bacterium]|nr:DUF4129 domain-containing protein [Pyrinomonadaceae bacterium]
MRQSSTTRDSLITVIGVLFVCLFVFPATVAAIPISEYQSNLKRAISTIETVGEPAENEADNDYYNRLKLSIEIIRISLPAHETVEFEGEVYKVDNSWLHKNLDELENETDLSERVREIYWKLRAIEERVAERQNPGNRTAENKQWAKTRMESILARPEYAADPKASNALFRLLQDFARWLAKWLPTPRGFSSGRVNTISLIAQIIVIAIAALVIIYVLKTLFVWFSGRSRRPRTRKKRAPRIVLGERLEPEATATDLLSEAEALARQGDLRAAIRKAYIALLVELGDRKLISLAHHKTNRDYLNSLRSVPQLHSRMRGLTDSFERHWYGYDNATPNDWQDFRAGYLAALQTESK